MLVTEQRDGMACLMGIDQGEKQRDLSNILEKFRFISFN